MCSLPAFEPKPEEDEARQELVRDREDPALAHSYSQSQATRG